MITKMKDFENVPTQKKNWKLVAIASVLAVLLLTVVLWAAWPRSNQVPSNKNKHDHNPQPELEPKLKSTVEPESPQNQTPQINQNTPMAESFILDHSRHKFRFLNDPAKNFEYRCKESKIVLADYPEKVPVVIEKAHGSLAPPLPHTKPFLVHKQVLVSHLIKIIQEIIKYNAPLNLYLNGVLLQDDELISKIYNESKYDDGFLYLLYV